MMQDWFSGAKLGIFVHYGIYAVGDVSESWSFHNGQITYEDYMKQCESFTASRYDPTAWARLFRQAGARYAVLTAKHHDGVALFDTRLSDLSVVRRTPAGRDLVAGYTAAMRSAGLRVGLYYSLPDWSDHRYPTLYPEGEDPVDHLDNIYATPAGSAEDPRRWQEFLAFRDGQLEELCTGYGPIDLLWFDGDWERSAAQWEIPRLREQLHRWQPDVILNSRLQGYGDYATPEQGIPLRSPQGPWEFCATLNTSWGYRASDNDYKTTRQVVRMLCDCLTLGGNLLLGIGPRADGTFDPRVEQTLLELGSWIRDNEEAVYQTGKGLDYCHFLGGSTLSHDKRVLYLFVYDRPVEYLCLKGVRTPVKDIRVLHTGQALPWRYTGALPWSGIPGTLWIDGSEMYCHPFTTVIRVELEGEITYHAGHGEVVTQN